MPKLKLEPIIGLEIHLELNTKSKFFCSCQRGEDFSRPNSNICPICLGHPGVLPVLNKEAIRKTLILGLALGGELAQASWFDRKNYFYPDLPKGYQISQYGLPLIKGGRLEIETSEDNPHSKKIYLERIHLEEDTAKLLHSPDKKWSLLDFNRAGVPLLEIVTKPDIDSPKEAKIFLQELHLVIRYLNISRADMEKGQFRCDANISLRPVGEKKYFPKTEIKNLNSFKAVENALTYEIERQKKLWQAKHPPKTQSTRGWDEKKAVTFLQRRKEEVEDYRYFPEPDLPPIDLTILKKQGIDLKVLKKDLIELPRPRRFRFVRTYGFRPEEAKILTEDKNLADFTEKVISELRAWLISLETIEGTEQEIWTKNKKRLVKLIANWLVNRLSTLLRKTGQKELSITPENFAEFIILVYEKKISSTLAQTILEKMFYQGRDIDQIMADSKLAQINDKNKIAEIIKEIIKDNPEIAQNFQRGKHNVIQYLIGRAMKKTRGRADPELIRRLFEKELS